MPLRSPRAASPGPGSRPCAWLTRCGRRAWSRTCRATARCSRSASASPRRPASARARCSAGPARLLRGPRAAARTRGGERTCARPRPTQPPSSGAPRPGEAGARRCHTIFCPLPALSATYPLGPRTPRSSGSFSTCCEGHAGMTRCRCTRRSKTMARTSWAALAGGSRLRATPRLRSSLPQSAARTQVATSWRLARTAATRPPACRSPCPTLKSRAWRSIRCT
mmetsp:Transcript_42548/g.135174  ORF Transcript_42548/g.135174 Transcript_42548/m.135174 type:complete len:223 (-) Transcript_42548:757-1425(-)